MTRAASFRTSDAPPLLSLSHVSKTFPGQKALDDVSLAVSPGEVHALLGQNGSGKSTLIKVLTGYYHPDAGAVVTVAGHEGHFTHSGPAALHGESDLLVRAVHQDLGLIGGLSVLDNVAIMIGYERGRSGRVDWRRQQTETRKLLQRVGVGHVDLHRPVDRCDPLLRTQIAIARAMADWGDRAGLLVLDEPTASLPSEQAEGLFRLVRELTSRGIGVLYVSHRLQEIVDLADTVSVLRDGRLVAVQSMAGLDHSDLVELMLGKSAAGATLSTTATAARETRSVVTPAKEREVALSVQGLTSTELHGLSFEVHRGEVLGFAGLVGSGQEELPYLLVGAKRALTGTVTVAGTTVQAHQLTPRRAGRLGVALVPADRANEAVMPQFDMSENMSLPQLAAFQVAGWLRPRRERDEAQSWVERLSIDPRDTSRLVTSLSGGNQQKVVLARWLAVARQALVLAEPTAGVDIGAKARIYEELRREAASGLPIVVCSTDVMDLVQVCTRIIVLSNGRAVSELVGDDIDDDVVTRAVLTKHTGIAS